MVKKGEKKIYERSDIQQDVTYLQKWKFSLKNPRN